MRIATDLIGDISRETILAAQGAKRDRAAEGPLVITELMKLRSQLRRFSDRKKRGQAISETLVITVNEILPFKDGHLRFQIGHENERQSQFQDRVDDTFDFDLTITVVKIKQHEIYPTSKGATRVFHVTLNIS
jgi:hypothetical protein